MTDEHLSKLAEWMLNTLGRALGLALLVGFGLAFVAAFTGEEDLMPLAYAGVPITFALVLVRAESPQPRDQAGPDGDGAA